MNFVLDLHKTMLSENLILVYEGEFTQEITKSVLSMAERNMDAIGEESNVKRKVFNVMVECLQNIVKHSIEDSLVTESEHKAIFMIGKTKDDYIITSGNPINTAQADLLKAKLDKINSLDRDGLKDLYKDIMKNGNLSNKGGAGLGFIDMARKSGKKLDYVFEKLDGQQSFFTIQTLIPRI